MAGADDDDDEDDEGDGLEGEGNDARHGGNRNNYRGEGVGEEDDGVDGVGMMGGSDDEEEEVDAVQEEMLAMQRELVSIP